MSQLPFLLQDLNVQILLDAGCGDFNWMRHVALLVEDAEMGKCLGVWRLEDP